MTERLTLFTDISKMLGPQTLLSAADGSAVFESQELSLLNLTVPYLEMGIKSPLPASLEEQNITVLLEILCTCRESYKIKARGSASLLPSHGRGIWPRDMLKKVSRGLSRVEEETLGSLALCR